MDTQADYFPDLMAQLQQGDRAARSVLLEQASREHPADPRPLLLAAADFIQAKEIDRAEAAYLLALQRAPNFAIARFQLGLLQMTCNRPAAALVTWGPLEQLEEKDPLRLFARGLAALAQGRPDLAKVWLAEGIAVNTVNPPLNRDMQKVFDQIEAAGQGQPPQGQEKANGKAKSEDQAHFLISTYRGAN